MGYKSADLIRSAPKRFVLIVQPLQFHDSLSNMGVGPTVVIVRICEESGRLVLPNIDTNHTGTRGCLLHTWVNVADPNRDRVRRVDPREIL
jgi:hypothetical protein